MLIFSIKFVLSRHAYVEIGFDTNKKFTPIVIISKNNKNISFRINQWFRLACLKSHINMSFDSFTCSSNVDQFIENIDGILIKHKSDFSKVKLFIVQYGKQIKLSKTEYKKLCTYHSSINLFGVLSEFCRSRISSFYNTKFKKACKRLKVNTLYGINMNDILPKINAEYYVRLITELNNLV